MPAWGRKWIDCVALAGWSSDGSVPVSLEAVVVVLAVMEDADVMIQFQ